MRKGMCWWDMFKVVKEVASPLLEDGELVVIDPKEEAPSESNE